MEKTAEKLNSDKMGTEKMFPLIMSMALPAMISMLVQALYNVVDSIFVSHYSQSAFTALSYAYPLQMVMISIGVGTGVGINSLISRRLGSGDNEDAGKAASHGIIIALIYWIVFIFLGLAAARPFLSMYTDNQQIISDGTSYLSIVMCFSVGLFVQSISEKTLQATGNMIVPMITQLTGALINIILDPMFIFGYWFFPEMGVAGAAIATVIAQIVAGAIVLFVSVFRKQDIKISLKGFRFSASILKNIYVVGLPAIVMQCIGSVMVSALNGIISVSAVSTAEKEATVNVFGIYFKLQSFIFMPVFGLNQGVTPIIGYNYGARNKKRLYSALRLGIIIALVIMTAGFAIFQIFPTNLLDLFSANEQMLKVGIPALRIISLCFIPAAVGVLFTALFQAVGKGVFSLLMSVMRQLVVIVPVAFVLSKISLEVMWFAFPVAEAVSLIAALFFFRSLVKGDFKRLDSKPVSVQSE